MVMACEAPEGYELADQVCAEEFVVNDPFCLTTDWDELCQTAYNCCINIPGCTDPEAYNFDPAAGCDDGSCIAVVNGCTDPLYTEYDASANTDDGSCATLAVNGCTDPTAFNYNASANTDDGSCSAVVNGCTDPLYTEYDPSANTDDGSCATLAPPLGWSCGDPLEYGGQSYATVQIGTQCWMAENLNIGTRINGSYTQTDNTIIEKYCNDDNIANCATYGGLYQWNEMTQYEPTYIQDTFQGVCPTGWHLPSDTEWTTLTTTLGGTGSNTGSKMADDAALWNNGALESDPEFGTSGLAVLPAGYRYPNGSFHPLGFNANLWSSTESGSRGWLRYLNYGSTGVYPNNTYDKDFGFSVRCLKD
jgi:uncharacterized protein (TIGR02145 family)